MNEQSLGFINQLIDKTERGKLSWSTGFEDGQFKTLLPDGKLAFVVQVKGERCRFLMLDDRQEVILDATVTRDDAHLDKVQGGIDQENLYEAILKLQELARSRALRVNEKLTKAGELLAAI
jgi:hypothetical protein